MQTPTSPGRVHTSMPFLNHRLATLASPSIERFQRIAREALDSIKPDEAHSPEEIEEQFKRAYERVSAERRSIHI